MKKVSVIIPVYNQQSLIVKCLDSIPKRDDIEIIVINDGSTDNSLKEIKNYKNFIYGPLIIETYDKNRGVSYARNRGLDIAKGEYICMIDSDDYIFPDEFNKIIEHHLLGKDIIFYNMEDNNKNIYEANRRNYSQKYGMFKFTRKDFIGDTRFKEGMQYAEDKEFYLRLLNKQPRMHFTNKVMYHYNYPRKGSLSAIGENR